MQKLLISIIFSTFFIVAFGQEKEVKSIKNAIKTFSKAGDEQNVKDLDAVLDDSYRVVMNRLFGSEEVSIMTKDTYLNKIQTGEFGGDKRKITFDQIVVNGMTASVKVTFIGKKMTFVSLLSLVKDKNGHWKLVSDLPTIS